MNYAPYVYRDLSPWERVIAVSDLHGNAAGFQRLLEAVHFGSRDFLILVGDLLEKGDQCLPLLRAVMRLAQGGNVLTLAGNNDRAFSLWRSGAVSDREMLEYARNTSQSILFEMAEELGLPWNGLEELGRLKAAIFATYAPEVHFLGALPFIVETEFAVFVHAGLKPGKLTEQEPGYCLAAPHFAQEPSRFPKLVVVGHWPVSNYSRGVLSLAPHRNPVQNSVSIDGGNGLKSWGQLNYLIFGPDRPNWTWGAVDDLPQVRLLDSQAANTPVTLHFPDTRAERRPEGWYLPALGETLSLPPERLYTYRGETYTADFTTYTPPIAPNTTAALCGEENGRILIKRDSVLGWYSGRWERE